MQTTQHILMIRPVRFGYNAETAVNNAFQMAEANQEKVRELACAEFDQFVALLRDRGVDVLVISDTEVPHTPDSIFPNNWISFHADGSVVLYPMFAENRRQERKPHILANIQQQFQVGATLDLSPYESQNLFLEGTGSMVLDRDNKITYACLSPRTDLGLLHYWCEKMGYTLQAFWAVDEQQQPIYHTNVMMCVADRYVVICLESITNPMEQSRVVNTIEHSGKQVIPITLEQMAHFAGNMLQVQNANGETLLVMSSQAYASLTSGQIEMLEKFNPVLHSSLNTIETNGGGSARCMMAEIHLPLKD